MLAPRPWGVCMLARARTCFGFEVKSAVNFYMVVGISNLERRLPRPHGTLALAPRPWGVCMFACVRTIVVEGAVDFYVVFIDREGRQLQAQFLLLR